MSDSGYEPQPIDGGATPPQDRRLWIIAGIVAVIAVIAVALLFTTLGDDDADDDVVATDSTLVESTTTASTSSSTSTSTSTTSEPDETTTSEPAVTTTTEGAPPVTVDPAQCREAGFDTDPESPAQTVFIAWTRGDTACAQELMTDDAFEDLFSRSGEGAQDQFQGCLENTDGDPHFDCAFTYEGGSTHYLMNFSPTDGWKVFDVHQVAD